MEKLEFSNELYELSRKVLETRESVKDLENIDSLRQQAKKLAKYKDFIKNEEVQKLLISNLNGFLSIYEDDIAELKELEKLKVEIGILKYLENIESALKGDGHKIETLDQADVDEILKLIK